MTTETLGRKATSIGDGVTTTFPVPFQFVASSDLRVYTHPTNVFDPTLANLSTEGIDYTITGDRRAGTASIVYVIPVPSGMRVTRYRYTSRDQDADYVPNDGFPAETHETQLDRLSLVTEELDDKIADVESRAIRVPVGESANVLPAAAGRKNKVLYFNPATGQPEVRDLVPTLTSVPAFPAPDVINIGSFQQIATTTIPAAMKAIRTTECLTGYGKGGAIYLYDPTVSFVFVAAHPGWSTLSADGRGWRLSPDQEIKFSMFGAKKFFDYPIGGFQAPTSTLDCTPNWIKAKDFLDYHSAVPQENPYYRTTIPIRFDEVNYYASAAFDLDRAYYIKGTGVGPNDCTTIYMQGGQCGFIFQSWDTIGVNSFKTNTPSGASHTVIEDICVQGNAQDMTVDTQGHSPIYIVQPLTLLGNEFHCGFLAKSTVYLKRCRARSFGGWGFAVRADINVGGNANLFRLEHCAATFNYGGLLISGGDVNAFQIENFDASGNITYGIWDKSFLGGVGIGGHLQGNGSAQYNSGPFWLDLNPSTSRYEPGRYIRPGGLVNHGGQTYRLVPGQEVAAVTTTPGTNSAVWQAYGLYDDQGSPRFPQWSAHTALISGGAIYVSDINCKSLWAGLYMEFDQPLGRMHNVSRAIAIGAFSSWDNGNFLNAVNGEFWSKGPIRSGGEVKQTTRMTPLGFRFTDDDENHLTYWEWTSHDLLMTYNLQPERSILAVTGNGTVKQFGRGAAFPDAFQIYNPVLGDDTNGRRIAFGSQAPTSGLHAKGERVLNNGITTALTTTREWVCTATGTPGTWQAFA